jgi:hypothetical protein
MRVKSKVKYASLDGEKPDGLTSHGEVSQQKGRTRFRCSLL